MPGELARPLPRYFNDMCCPSERHLIQSIFAAHDKGPLVPQKRQRLGDQLLYGKSPDAEELKRCARRICKRANEIEYRRLTELFSHRRDMPHRGMQLGRETKANAQLI